MLMQMPVQKSQLSTEITDELRARILTYAINHKITFDAAVIELLTKGAQE